MISKNKIKFMKQEIKVYNKDGGYVRTYSVEDQGKDFMDIAKGFAKKIGGKIEGEEAEAVKKAGEVKEKNSDNNKAK